MFFWAGIAGLTDNRQYPKVRVHKGIRVFGGESSLDRRLACVAMEHGWCGLPRRLRRAVDINTVKPTALLMLDCVLDRRPVAQQNQCSQNFAWSLSAT